MDANRSLLVGAGRHVCSADVIAWHGAADEIDALRVERDRLQEARDAALMDLPEDDAWAIVEPWLDRQRERTLTERRRRPQQPFVERRVVTPAEMTEQRARCWADWHPEDYCHRCRHPNMLWWVASERWNESGADDGPWNGIVCPQCFAELWSAATGWRVHWQLVLDDSTRHAAALGGTEEEGT